MADSVLTTPYASAMPFVAGDLPAWLDEYNAQRLAAYDLYDDLYDNVPETNALLLRVQDDRPIFIPSAKRLCKSLSRYIGKGWGYRLVPETGTSGEQVAAMTALSGLFKREAVISQFASGKTELLRRGDWVWMITADAEKPEGKRLSVTLIDPRTYFPIFDDSDPGRLSGAMLVEQYLLDDETTIAVRLQRYLKPNHPEHPNFEQVAPAEGFPIAYDEQIRELEGWQSAEQVLLQTPVPLDLLEGIYALPLYHVKINSPEADPFGRSELSGLESVLAGINQTVSDEDLSLALAGLGMYTTTAGAPVNDAGDPVPWQMGPARVIEHAKDTVFQRLDGIDDVTPYQDHIKFLQEAFYGTSGINDIALGKNGAQPESGIALAIKMQPLFDTADDIDLAINTKMSHLLHDLLRYWFPTYEGQGFGEVEVEAECDTGDRLPFDRTQRWAELIAGYEAGFFSLKYVHKVLTTDLGYDLTEQDLTDALADSATKAAQADPYGARVAGEVAASDSEADATAE